MDCPLNWCVGVAVVKRLTCQKHASVTLVLAVGPSADLDDFADSATPDVMVSEDVPMLHEVTRAIRRLKNGRVQVQTA